MPRASRDGVSIAYEIDPVGTAEAGKRSVRADSTTGGDAPIVFVPGVELGRWAWRWQREAFRGQRRVIVPFLRGTGPRARTDGGVAIQDGSRRSDAGLAPLVPSLPRRLRRPIINRWGGYAVEDLAADLETVIADDAALGRGRTRDVHLVGQGLGGAVALQYALEYDRARSLSLVGTRHGGSETPDTPESIRSQVLDPADTGRQRQRNRLRPFFADAFVARNPHLFDRILVWQDEQGPDAVTREAQWAAWDRFDASNRLAALTVPTLVVHGTADRLVPVEHGHALAEEITESTIQLIEGGGHLVGIEEEGRMNERLEAFVRSVEETTNQSQ